MRQTLSRYGWLCFVALGLSAYPAGLAGAGERQDVGTQGASALEEKIVFTDTCDDPAGDVILMNPDGTGRFNLTRAFGVSDGFATISPKGNQVVFESNRLRTESEPINTSDLFLTSRDGTELNFLIRGSSATWSPDGHNIAYHASASGAAVPPGEPGTAADDSDIFSANVDDLLAGVPPTNLTNDGPLYIDEDADWSPDGTKIAFTRRQLPFVYPDPNNKIQLMNADGSGVVQLDHNTDEERAPAWSPDGTRIAYMCTSGGLNLEICTIKADGTDKMQLTFTDNVVNATPAWSPDGTKIVFHGDDLSTFKAQLFVMNADGSD